MDNNFVKRWDTLHQSFIEDGIAKSDDWLDEFQDIIENVSDDIVDLGSTFSNFSDTAGAIENMDLIISNDTSLVHLAGAMQKNCWVLLPYIYNWRWHTDLSVCDWYDSVKLFRLNKNESWKELMEKVVKTI